MNKDFSSALYDYKKWRESFILLTLRAASILGVILIGVSFGTATPTDRILFPSLIAALLAITVLKVQYKVRAYAFLFIIYVVGVNAIIGWGPWLDGSIFFFGCIVMSALLFDDNTDAIVVAITVVTFLIIAILQQTGFVNLVSTQRGFVTNSFNWITYLTDLLIPSALVVYAVRQFKKEFGVVTNKMQETFLSLEDERKNLEERVQERTAEIETRNTQMRSSAMIARTVADVKNIEELLEAITTLASGQLGYSHVGLYLLDENKKTAFLQASSSETGKRLIGQSLHIEPNRRNPLYIVTESKQAVISSDSAGASFLKDPSFPQMRSRLTLPLSARNEILGILDIHSNRPNAFNAQDAETMQTLADITAISIANVRLISESQSLVMQLEANTAFQTRQTWANVVSRQLPAYLYTPAGLRPIFSFKQNREESADNSAKLKIPLLLNGQRIGRIQLKRKGASASWSERERELVEKISLQVALALENSRLVEEAQKSALRDKAIANVSARVRETLEVESVLRVAATELRKVFDLKEVEVSIGEKNLSNEKRERP